MIPAIFTLAMLPPNTLVAIDWANKFAFFSLIPLYLLPLSCPKSAALSCLELVVPGKKDLKVAGLAVFRGDKMVGWLGEEEAQGLLLVTGRAKNGAIAVGHLPDMAGEATLRPPLESFVRAAQSTPSAKAARSALTSPSA